MFAAMKFERMTKAEAVAMAWRVRWPVIIVLADWQYYARFALDGETLEEARDDFEEQHATYVSTIYFAV